MRIEVMGGRPSSVTIPSSIESDGHAILEVGAAKHPVSVQDGASARGRAVRVADAIGRPSPTLVIREREHRTPAPSNTAGTFQRKDRALRRRSHSSIPFPSRKLPGLLLSLLADARSPTPAASLRPREPRTKPRVWERPSPTGVRGTERGSRTIQRGPAWRADRLTDLPAGLVYLVLATLPPAVPRSSRRPSLRTRSIPSSASRPFALYRVS